MTTGARNLAIIRPALRFEGGNRVTASRWAEILRRLGWNPFEEDVWSGRSCDVMVALNARLSHASIESFHRDCPERPIVVVATGTDVYGDEAISPEAHGSFLRATRVVVLQPRAIDRLPESMRGRARVVYQSVSVPRHRLIQNEDVFEVCAIAHLRPVKDPLLLARAARLLPVSSRIRVLHLGGLIDESMREEVEREQRENPRFRWLGDRPRSETLEVLARSRVFVSSSRHEGGSNAISEALALGIPILATAIPGSLGLLGDDHPGTYAVGDARALAQLLHRSETDADFLRTLEERSIALAGLTDPARELESWRALLAEISS